MPYTLSSMQTEFYARGFDDLSTTAGGIARGLRWLNDAMHEIDSKADWPYKTATSATGPAPLTIADFQTIESVVNVGNSYVLQPISRRDLRRYFGDLTTTGTSLYYYIVNGVINVYPVSTITLTVDYWKVPVDLVSAADAPLMPDRYRVSIIDYACARAAYDRGDFTGAQNNRRMGDQMVQLMASDLLLQQHQISQDTVDMSGDDQ